MRRSGVRRMRDLDQMAAKLLQAARKLPPGQARQDALKEVGKLRARIDVLRQKTELSVGK
jgi:hypothetical protein